MRSSTSSAGAITTAAWPVSRQLSSSVSGCGRAAAAVARVLARPEDLPAPALGRGQERLGGDREPQLGAEVHQQAAGRRPPGPNQRSTSASGPSTAPSTPPGRWRRNTGSSRRSRSRSRCSASASACGLRVALGRVELRALERLAGPPGGAAAPASLGRQAGELREELLAAPVHRVGELGLVVAEVEERARRGELLPLEEQRRGRAEQLQRRHGPDTGRGWSAVAAARPGPSWRPGRGSGDS